MQTLSILCQPFGINCKQKYASFEFLTNTHITLSETFVYIIVHRFFEQPKQQHTQNLHTFIKTIKTLLWSTFPDTKEADLVLQHCLTFFHQADSISFHPWNYTEITDHCFTVQSFTKHSIYFHMCFTSFIQYTGIFNQ